MDRSRFDDLTRAMAATTSRRAGLRAALAGLLGLRLAAGAALAAPEAGKRKKSRCAPKCANGFTCRKKACVCEQGLVCRESCCAFGQVCGGEGEPDCVTCPSGVSCAGLCCEATDTCVGAVCTPCETRNVCDGVCCGASERCGDGRCKACESGVGCRDACCRAGETCQPGGCTCASGVTCSGVCCPVGQQCIGGACQRCDTVVCNGACCAAGQACVDGRCGCASGVACNGACCAPGQSCLSGRCATCASGVICNGACCPRGQSCVDGRCAGPAPTCTVTAGPDARANGTALQAAIDAAIPGATVTLGAGAYEVGHVGPHDVAYVDWYGIATDKDIAVMPCDPGAGRVVVTASPLNRHYGAFAITGGSLLLEGLAIEGAGAGTGDGVFAAEGIGWVQDCSVTGFEQGIVTRTGRIHLLGDVLVTRNRTGLMHDIVCSGANNRVCSNGDTATDNCYWVFGPEQPLCGCATTGEGRCPAGATPAS